MESFFRYIAYVDYYKNGEKIKNVGFLRWKLYKDLHLIEMQVKDVPVCRGEYKILERNTQKAIGEIAIDKGIGNFSGNYPSMSATGDLYINTREDRLYLYDVEGFFVRLNESEYLSVDVELEQEKKKEKFNLSSERKTLFEEDMKAASENVLIEGIEEKYQIADNLSYSGQEVKSKKDSDIDKQDESYIDISPKKVIKILEPLHEDKWQQLCKDYPKVHPFSDRKTFLSVRPEDFVILQQEYQKLVQNSFLLHGFYNYGHMILGKLTEEEGAPIYIGVPGVYYEREKQAARMFGFVGFESTEQPVQAGSYGYYMMEVKI